MDKKTIKLLVGILAGFILFIIILFLIAGCNKHSYSYSELKEKMTLVADEYFKKDENKPKNDGEEASYTLNQMINDGKIDSIEKLFDKKDYSCSGEVTAVNNDGNLLFTTILNCDDKEDDTVFLNNKVIADNLVTTGVGLYQNETTNGTRYIFKGETKNNYINWNEELYRIIRINEDGTIRVMKFENDFITSWDNRYNNNTLRSSGYNTYYLTDVNIDSRIKEKLKNDYDKLSNESKKYIASQSLCIGERDVNESINDGTVECSKTLDNQKYGLLTVYEYLQATLDPNCNTISDRECKNYNWIAAASLYTWLITPVSGNDYEAYYLLNNKIQVEECNNVNTYIPVFNITKKALYVSGDGTKTNPYTFN